MTDCDYRIPVEIDWTPYPRPCPRSLVALNGRVEGPVQIWDGEWHELETVAPGIVSVPPEVDIDSARFFVIEVH